MKDEPTAQAIFGALCMYLLVGFSFASLYGMLAAIQPHAFHLDPALNLHTVPDRFDLIYYSFATITCLGATGITPVSDQARSISVHRSAARCSLLSRSYVPTAGRLPHARQYTC